eukprot:m.23224 g.23224  ORF g.23224 m.23224 type:complete len:384 (-) comp11011_c0_seq1:49-1200(-)
MLGAALVVALLLGLPASAVLPNPAQGFWLTQTEESGARCLDGTPGMYYLRPSTGGVNSTKWVIHIQGGAWCESLEDCVSRSKSRLGSSLRKFQPCADPREGQPCHADLDHIEGCNNTRWCGSLMVNDPDINPLAYDWNAVLFMYCDGGSWTGDTETTYQGTQLHFRGRRLFDGVVQSLLKNHAMDQATMIILGGDSAGGMATYIHADHFSEMVPHAQVLAIPDSGFFLDVPNSHYRYRDIFNFMNSTSGLNKACVAAHTPDTVYQCMFSQYTAPYLQTPVLAKQSQYDPAQPMAHSDAEYVNAYGHNLTLLIQQAVLGTPAQRQRNGLFLDSCYQHCGFWTTPAGEFGNVTMTQAVSLFLQKQQSVWVQNKPYPCKDCCGSTP